jgi:geranylgeranyl transferase type-1 subunit beta
MKTQVRNSLLLFEIQVLISYKDPYHTYLSIAALTVFPPNIQGEEPVPKSWEFGTLDPLLNASGETIKWIREHVPAKIA